MENNKENSQINKKINTTSTTPEKSDTLLKVVGWIILIITLVCVVLLAIVGGIMSFEEMKEASNEGGGMPAGIPLSLHYALSLFIATLISFGIVFLLAAKFFWKPMKDHLEIRKQNIETNIDAASYSRKEAQKELEDAKKSKKQIKDKAEVILAESKTLANKERREILDQAKREQDALIERTREQIEKEKEQLKDDIRNEILSTSLLAAEKIIEKQLDAEANTKMINELLDSLK